MSTEKPYLLFVYLSNSTFVDADLNILKKEFRVKEFPFFSKTKSNLLIPFRWLVQFFWLALNIRKVDIIYSWFVDYHLLIPSFFAKWFNKPIGAVIGGVDAVNIPEWKHGIFASYWRAPIANMIYKRCSILFPVSKSLVLSENAFTYYPNKVEFGIEKELGKLSTKILPLATGYDKSFWKLIRKDRKPLITTVAFINSKKRVWIKGIDLFIETAKRVPNATFQIIGIDKKHEPLLGVNLPKNLVVKGKKSTSELVHVYNESSIYLQLSRLEGLPNVLCEAMMCGCIPIGSAVFGIKEVLNEEGFLVNEADPENIASLVNSVLESSASIDREVFRRSILERFSLQKRKSKLVEELNNLISEFKK